VSPGSRRGAWSCGGRGWGLRRQLAVDLLVTANCPAVVPESSVRASQLMLLWRLGPPSASWLCLPPHHWCSWEVQGVKPAKKTFVVVTVLIWLHASLVFLTRYLGFGVLQCKGGDGNVGRGEY